MEMNGSHIIPADRETVWAALNNPDVLRACIPGCKELEMQSPTDMTATVVTKIGPVKATFKGAVKLQNLNPPESYTIAGEGKGGIAGFAKGGADVTLDETEEGTVLAYTVDAKVGGKIAQLGSRLIDSTAKKLAEQFFTNFSDHVSGDEAVSATA
ncbi:MAG: carbon monoxide dehydrogenase subunit G [Pseudomonadota bacterium]